jgi:hypothetical protein
MSPNNKRPEKPYGGAVIYKIQPATQEKVSPGQVMQKQKPRFSGIFWYRRRLKSNAFA